MSQNIKQRILKNHLFLIILINLIQLGALAFTIVWPPWYNDQDSSNSSTTNASTGATSTTTNDNSSTPTLYGLLFTWSDNNRILNGFSNENNKEIGGISSFILFAIGMSVQILYIVQLAWFIRKYPRVLTAPNWKIMKFKTCRWVSLFLYVGALCYWMIVVFIVQVVSDSSNFSGLQYGFWLAITGIIVYVLVSIYLNFLKKSIRKNDLVSNLLIANRNIHNENSNNNKKEGEDNNINCIHTITSFQ